MTDAMGWPAPEIARALGLPLPRGAETRVVHRIETDSRRARPGDLFVALPGTRTDGHRFLRAAAAGGVSAILCGRGRAAEAGDPAPPAFEVDDPLAAYRQLAAAWRRRFPGPVVAVAGSVGKTTTTGMVHALLVGAFPRGGVYRSPPQRNGWVGLPKSLLELRPGTHAAAVLEVGTDAPGMTGDQVAMLAPDAMLVTAVAEEHLDQLGDLEGVAREQGLAFRETGRWGGTLVVNGDDPRVTAQAAGVEGPRLVFTRDPGSSPNRGRLVGRVTPGVGGEDAGARLTITGGPFGKTVSVPVPLAGAHQATNLLGAIAAVVAIGVDDEGALTQGIAGFVPPRGRGELRRLASGATLQADHYNASPRSVRAALETVRLLRDRRGGGARLVLAFGDRLELGTDELEHHRRLASAVLESTPAVVHLLGPRMTALADELARGPGGPAAVFHHADHASLAAALAPETRRPDTILLLKGSRGMAMERALPEHDLGF